MGVGRWDTHWEGGKPVVLMDDSPPVPPRLLTTVTSFLLPVTALGKDICQSDIRRCSLAHFWEKFPHS